MLTVRETSSYFFKRLSVPYLQMKMLATALPLVKYTVKLGYNNNGYNEFTIIMNKIMSHFWSQMTGYKDIFQGYNESRLKQTFFDGPLVFVITEFDCRCKNMLMSGIQRVALSLNTI